MERITEFEEFCRALEEEARAYALSEYGAEVHLVEEPNGQKGPAVIWVDKSSSAYPMLELHSIWEQYKTGAASLSDCARVCIDKLHNAEFTEDMKDMIFDVLGDRERLKEVVTLRLVNPKYFRGAYDLVGEDFLDLRAVVCISAVLNGMTLGTGIKKDTAKSYGLSEEELFSFASRVTERDAVFFKLNDVLKETGFKFDDDYNGIMVMTNTNKFYGAASITDKTLLRKVADAIGTSFAIIPSSVHELLVVPCGGMDELDTISGMVKEVNAEVVKPSEWLGDHAYFCNADTLEISW